MSSILKALKKLEHDKISYHPDELKIDAEILRTETSPRFSVTGALLLSVVLLVGGSGATYWFMKQTPPPAPARQTAPVRNSRPVTAEPPVANAQLPDAIEVVPATQQKNIVRNNSKTYQQRNSISTPVRDVVTPKPVQSGAAPGAVNSPSHSEPPPTTPAIPKVPALRVNGIAFRGEGADTVAMINNIPLTRGSVIEGVKVEEIYQNMVKFSFNGETFEIRMGQSNR